MAAKLSANPKITTGQRFGRLVAHRLVYLDRPMWLCICDCGRQRVILPSSLTRGKTSSCGCLRREMVTTSNTTHGDYASPTYRSWIAMCSRCTNPRRPAFSGYGGAGIKVCDSWRRYENFLADMGPRPEGTSLERRNNSLGYSPENCYWGTRREQAWNRRSTIWVEHAGERKPRGVWAREIGISDGALANRLRKYSVPVALFKEQE